jgi:hypothetical protein
LGEVAGDYEKGPQDQTFGFVYFDGAYTTINVPGSKETYVTGINAKGQVTGYYLKGSDDLGFIATPQSAAVNLTPSGAAAAPEPSTWAMLLSGFAGLGLIGYRKARSGRAALFAG